MNPSLQEESAKLARSWSQHEAAWLRDYLVAGVEDPRINLQSILTRHFLVREILAPFPAALLEQEYHFSAAMNWLSHLQKEHPHQEELELVLFGLRQGVDNVEGIPIPVWASRIFQGLPCDLGGVAVPNYIEAFLEGAAGADRQAEDSELALNTFAALWREVLSRNAPPSPPRLSVLEPACGSANDYRFFALYGLAPWLEYGGFDLCEANIANARALFPHTSFRTGNVFEIDARDCAFDCCVVHDLFEHLSPEGLEMGLKEICRVSKRGLCLGFFQMEAIPEHVVRPVEDYHWNLLSLGAIRDFLAHEGFAAQVFHAGTFLRQQTGSDQFHNPQAYTFWARRVEISGN